MRKLIFNSGEYYHVFNRGVDKRIIFDDEYDYQRFLESMTLFNTVKPIGSIYEQQFQKKSITERNRKLSENPLVDILSYCLNPNHYHLLLKQKEEMGVTKFLHRLGLGYTNYFNRRNTRVGALFQGRFKAVHVESNEQLLHTSVYVNLNNLAHKLGNRVSKSSAWEYGINSGEQNEPGEREKTKKVKICDTADILKQFNEDLSYEQFSNEAMQLILAKKAGEKEILWLE